MDSIDSFFQQHQNIKHNKDAKTMPSEFVGWEHDNTILEKYFLWIRFESQCASLKLNINSEMTAMREELKTKHIVAIPHEKGYSSGWKAITLFGFSSILTHSSHSYIDSRIITKDDKADWTDVSKYFPETVSWIKKYSPWKEYTRIRVMVLEPSGYISPHKDFDKHILGGGGVNIAVTNPVGTEFVLEDAGIIPFYEGDWIMVDVGRMHSVRNLSLEPRIHIIIHTIEEFTWNVEAMRLACASYTTYQETL
jgi:hypothetical protein